MIYNWVDYVRWSALVAQLICLGLQLRAYREAKRLSDEAERLHERAVAHLATAQNFEIIRAKFDEESG